MKNKTLAYHVQQYERIAAISLGALLCLGAFLYGYFVLHSISQVLVRTQVERDIARLSSEVSDFELSYVARKNELNLDEAVRLGFQEASKKVFVAKKTLVGGLSLNSRE